MLIQIIKRRNKMAKLKKITTFICCALLALTAFVTLFGCNGSEETEETKYDVAIRVKCSDGEIYEFTYGEDEKHITIPYDGKERSYWVDSYNLPDHPRYGDEWFSPSGEGANVFGKTMTYCKPGELNASYSGAVKEVGEYCISIYADSTSTLWKFRSIYLFIVVI